MKTVHKNTHRDVHFIVIYSDIILRVQMLIKYIKEGISQDMGGNGCSGSEEAYDLK